MFGKKRNIPEPSGMIVNTPQPGQPGQPGQLGQPMHPGQPYAPQYQIVSPCMNLNGQKLID